MTDETNKKVKTHLNDAVRGQGLKDSKGSQYDKEAKEILADPQVVAHIVSSLVPGFTHLSPEEVERDCLVDPIMVAAESVSRADRAIAKLHKIELINGEDATTNEPKTVFDVYTKIKLPLNDKNALVELNLERERDESRSYPIEKRATYYIARLLSIQGENLVAEEAYGLLHRVVSIWIIVEPHASNCGTVSHTHLVTENLIGEGVHKSENTDLVDIFYVGLNKDAPGSSEGVIGMLEVLFSTKMVTAEKIQRLENDYNMVMTVTLEERMNTMSSLSQGIYDDAFAEGVIEGQNRKMAEAEEAKAEAEEAKAEAEEAKAEAEEAKAKIIESNARSVITLMNKQGFTIDGALDFFEYDRAERATISEKIGELLT